MDRYHLENPGALKPDELSEDAKLIIETGLNMIQWRNFNIDPDWYMGKIGAYETGDLLGIKQLQELIHEEFPQVKFGYFNPSMERITGNYEEDFAH